jgi:hypothetical protein
MNITVDGIVMEGTMKFLFRDVDENDAAHRGTFWSGRFMTQPLELELQLPPVHG